MLVIPSMDLVRRYPLAAFSLLAYAWTWVCFGTNAPALTALSQGTTTGFGLPELIVLLAPFGPTFAALLLTGVLEGRPGLRELWRRLCLWRVGLGYYVFVLGWLVAVKVGGVALWSVTRGGWTDMPNLSHWADAPLRFVVMLFVGGPLGEEIGWRGFALPRLVARHGPVGASLRLGPLWALWHLPVFLIPGVDQYGQPLFWYVVMVTAYTFLLTWIHQATRGSLLLALLHHTAINVALWLTSMPSLRTTEWRLFSLDAAGPWLMACALAWVLVGAIAAVGGFRTPSKVAS